MEMVTKKKLLLSFAPTLSVICLFGFWLLDIYPFNVRILVVVFWLSVLFVIMSLFIRCYDKKYKYGLVASVPILLYLPSDSIWAWTTWWINGFGP